MSEATETAQKFLDRTIADIAALADVYAERVVIEMPFAAPLFPVVHEVTREELRAMFTRAGAPTYREITDVRIVESTDPHTAVVEYRLHGTNAGGEEFALDYIAVITTENGLIVHSRDYSSLVQAARSMGLTERLVAELTSTK